MKYLITVILLVVILGCSVTPDGGKKTGRFGNVKTIEYDGHEYILYDTAMGSSITHKYNCSSEQH